MRANRRSCELQHGAGSRRLDQHPRFKHGAGERLRLLGGCGVENIAATRSSHASGPRGGSRSGAPGPESSHPDG